MVHPLRRGLLAMLVLAGSAAAQPSAPTPARFSDVPAGHWAADAVAELGRLGILQGDGGSFRGESYLNRYQVAVIVKRLMDEIKRRRAGLDRGPPAG